MLSCTVENPGHFEDENVVKTPGVVVLEDLDHILNQLHVHVLQAATRTVKHQGELVSVVLPKVKKYWLKNKTKIFYCEVV